MSNNTSQENLFVPLQHAGHRSTEVLLDAPKCADLCSSELHASQMPALQVSSQRQNQGKCTTTNCFLPEP